MSFARNERDACCDALLSAGPDAPTLCAGWTAHDLAAHLWVRENDPIGVPGMFVPALAKVTDDRMARVKKRWPFPELVETIRRGPKAPSLFALPGLDEQANTVEYFVHTEDVRRPAGLEPRELPAELEDVLWGRARSMAKLLLRGSHDGIVLERETGESAHVQPGSEIVTVIGKPSELMLFTFGRKQAARVRYVGEAGAVMRVRRD
ncbi:TIGR03085 family metal-binding protein [Nigerium massiliense]|uniref:TIGR03085 family metal-binding protein n=1 Tax=Nigerium massiliense TaxID=1522317 RepID=UPI0005916181|nr:TIGR03085 family metal-binding protein [Nigerium massiliense]